MLTITHTNIKTCKCEGCEAKRDRMRALMQRAAERADSLVDKYGKPFPRGHRAWKNAYQDALVDLYHVTWK